jgi:hypothetical protein
MVKQNIDCLADICLSHLRVAFLYLIVDFSCVCAIVVTQLRGIIMATFRGLKITRIKPSAVVYAELSRLCGDTRKYKVSPEDALKITRMILLRVNNQRKKQGLSPLRHKPNMIFTKNTANCGWSDEGDNDVKVPRNCNIGTLIHELAHWLHMYDALGWMISLNERGTQIFDCHGKSFIKYLQWQRDIVLTQKGFQKFLVK